MEFDFTVEQISTITSFRLSGKLMDRSQADQLVVAIESNISDGKKDIVLNLEDLSYLNSSGLNLIIIVQKKVLASGGKLALCSVNKKIMDLLIITKLHTVFAVLETIKDVEKKFYN